MKITYKFKSHLSVRFTKDTTRTTKKKSNTWRTCSTVCVLRCYTHQTKNCFWKVKVCSWWYLC